MGVLDRLFEGTKISEKIKTWRGSRKLVLLIVFVALLLDNMLLTAVVPIIPNFLHQLDLKSEQNSIGSTLNYNSNHLINERQQDFFHTSSTTSQLNNSTTSTQVQITISSLDEISPMIFITRTHNSRRKYGRKSRLRKQSTTTRMADTTEDEREKILKEENVAVGLMFASKALVQLLVNPFVGPITNKIGYSIPMFSGFVIMFVSTLIFAFGKSYAVLFVARSIQGIGSACSSVSGMGMLASLYPDDKERGSAMSIALGGLAFGVLIGPPFGGVMYQFFGKASPFLFLAALTLGDGLLQLMVLQPKVQAEKETGSSLKELLSDPYILIAAASITFANMGIAVLEPTLPLHMSKVMEAEKWEQGVAFLPCSIAYLLGTNLFGPLSHKFGRWLSAMVGMIIIGVSLFIIPLATSTSHLILPNFGLGFAIGMVDSSMLPIMGHLVDLRHAPVYGSVYAITDVAFCLGFAIGPALSGTILNTLGFKWMLWLMAIVDLAYSPFLGFLRNPPSRSEKQALMLPTTRSNQALTIITCSSRDYDMFHNDEELETSNIDQTHPMINQ